MSLLMLGGAALGLGAFVLRRYRRKAKPEPMATNIWDLEGGSLPMEPRLHRRVHQSPVETYAAPPRSPARPPAPTVAVAPPPRPAPPQPTPMRQAPPQPAPRQIGQLSAKRLPPARGWKPRLPPGMPPRSPSLLWLSSTSWPPWPRSRPCPGRLQRWGRRERTSSWRRFHSWLPTTPELTRLDPATAAGVVVRVPSESVRL